MVFWLMPAHPTVFSQLTVSLYQTEFARCAELFPMPRRSRSFSAYDHFLALCFGQLTYRESLRDIIACLTSRPQMQYHLGFRGRVTRTNFAYANEHRDWRVFASVAEMTGQLWPTELKNQRSRRPLEFSLPTQWEPGGVTRPATRLCCTVSIRSQPIELRRTGVGNDGGYPTGVRSPGSRHGVPTAH